MKVRPEKFFAVFVCGSLVCFLSAVLDQGAVGFSEGGCGGAASSSAGGVLSEDAASICARGVFLNYF